jgi:CRP-like cAMP-binding protein
MTNFGRMMPGELVTIAENTVDRYFEAGAEIQAEGAPVTCMHYVLEGRVAVLRKGVIISVLDAPAVVGGLGVLAGHDGQQMIAEEDCWTLEMPAGLMDDVFEDNFPLMVMMIRALTAQLIEARREAGSDAGFDSSVEEVAPPEHALSIVDKLYYLRHNAQFLGQRIETIIGLARSAREVRLPAGTVLWQRGDAGHTWLILISGVIACEGDGQRFRFGPGSSVGGLDSLAAVPRWYDATIATDVVAMELDGEELIDIFEDNVDVAMSLARSVARGLLAVREQNAQARSDARRKAGTADR